MWICLSVPKDLANLWTDMVLLYSVISPVQRRFIAILETLPPRSKEKFAQKILTCYPVLQGCPNVFFLRVQLKFEGGGEDDIPILPTTTSRVVCTAQNKSSHIGTKVLSLWIYELLCSTGKLYTAINLQQQCYDNCHLTTF